MSSTPARTQADLNTEALIKEVSSAVSKATGIILGERQSAMVASRIKRRIVELGLKDESVYFQHFTNNRNAELPALISLLTTHHTYFFREFAHFEFLERTGLPRIIADKRAKGDKRIRIWSAACSRGQEVYSLAMLMSSYLKQNAPDFDFEVFGSDVDPESVAFASNGVYRDKEIHEIPLHFLGDHWAKGSGDIACFVKAKRSIRGHCKFSVFNLIDFKATELGNGFDIIFCRNVFIYFAPHQIKDITKNFLKHLSPQGYLFLGISESLNGLDLPVSSIGPSIYQLGSAAQTASAPKPVTNAPPPSTSAGASHPRTPLSVVSSNPSASQQVNQPAKPLRVLCVDDSPSILTILKKLLVSEYGFEVIGTAGSGLEAKEKLKTLKPDLVTLDIHMPGQDGLTYLKTSFNGSHPPVVMISSVSREDATLALQCIEAGASDYIEKPGLKNLAERADEIRTKLRYAAQRPKAKHSAAFERSISRTPAAIKSPETKLRVLVATFAEREKVLQILADQALPGPATLIVLEGAGHALEAFKDFLKKKASATKNRPVETGVKSGVKLNPNTIYLCDSSELGSLPQLAASLRTSCMILGQPSDSLLAQLSKLKACQFLIEDFQNPSPALTKIASDITPATSFAYNSDHYLAGGSHEP